MGVGRAAGTLNSLLGRHIELEVPKIDLVGIDELSKHLGIDQHKIATVTLGFYGPIEGNASVLFDQESALQLVDLLVPGALSNPEEVDAVSESTITEVGNIIVNSVMGTIANCFQFELDFRVPRYSDNLLLPEFDEKEKEKSAIVLFGETFLIVENKKITGKILIFFALNDLKDILASWREPNVKRA